MPSLYDSYLQSELNAYLNDCERDIDDDDNDNPEPETWED